MPTSHPVPGTTAGGPALLNRPARAATTASLAAAALAVGVEVLVPGGWGPAAGAVLLGGLLLGLPHGAIDHLVPAYRLRWRPVRMVLFALGYAALAGVAYAAFRAVPAAALAVFVAVSAWHFGSGETAFADLRTGRPVRGRITAATVVGAAVVLVPLARGLADPAGETAALVGGVAPGWSPPAPGVLQLVVLVVAAAAACLGIALLRRRRWLEAAELSVLLVLVLGAPPLVAFGVYFGAWHSVRHVARMVAEAPANAADLADGRLPAPLARFATPAGLPTSAVLAALAVLWSAAGGWQGLVVAHLPLLAALTLPHVLVVAWLDRQAPRGGGTQSGSRRMGTCGIPSST